MAVKNINAEQLKKLLEGPKPVLVDFWAQWCPHCRKINPAYEQIARQYADTLEVVKLDMDEGDHLWTDFGVELIPTLRLYIDGKASGSIVAPESKAAIDAFLSPILTKQKKADSGHIHDMIIIGGGPGGYTAALYAARAGLDVMVLERLAAGGQMALTDQIDNYPGFVEGVDGYALAEQMQRQAARFGAQTRNADVQSVRLHANPRTVETSEGTFYTRTIVMATGANPRELGISGEQELVGRGVAYCAACDGALYRNKTVVIVGGGNTAAADALLLSRVAKKVVIIHRRDTLRATKIYHESLAQADNVEFRWNSVVTGFIHGDRLTGIRLKNVQTGEESEIACDGVFISVGRKPATKLAAGQLALDESGYIIAGETTETNIPGVYAVGDVRTKRLRQVVTAVADGAMAVHMAEEYLAGAHV